MQEEEYSNMVEEEDFKISIPEDSKMEEEVFEEEKFFEIEDIAKTKQKRPPKDRSRRTQRLQLPNSPLTEISTEEEEIKFDPSKYSIKPIEPSPTTKLKTDAYKKVIDPKDILSTFFNDHVSFQCNDIQPGSIFFLHVKLGTYKPFEILFFNLQRSLLMPELTLSNRVKEDILALSKWFHPIYLGKKGLYRHLSADKKVLLHCLKLADLDEVCSDDLKPYDEYHEGGTCTSHFRNLLLRMTVDKLPPKPPDESKRAEFSKWLSELPDFIHGIWDEFFENSNNEGQSLGEFSSYFSTFYSSTDLLWTKAKDLDEMENTFKILQKNFPSELKNKSFPRKSIEEALLKMGEYDTKKETFSIALIGDKKRQCKIVSWFMKETSSTIKKDHVESIFLRAGMPVILRFYLFSVDCIKVSPFDGIIQLKAVNYPSMNADLKHFVNHVIFCNNRPVSTCHTRIRFIDLKTRDAKIRIWQTIDWITRKIPKKSFTYVK